MRIAVYRLELLHLIRYAFCSSTVYYFRVSKIVRPILSFVGPRKFKKIDNDAIEGFSSIHANSMNTCSDYLLNSSGIDCIALRFISERLGGQVEAAESYYLKSVAARRLYDTMLYAASLKAFEEQNNIQFETVTVPKEMKPYLDALAFDPEKRCVRYQYVFKGLLRLGLCLAYLLRRYIAARNMRHSFSETKVKYVTEVADMSCFGGTIGHPDFIEKFLHLQREEVGYFKFAFNSYISKIKHNSPGEIRRFAEDKKINYIDADSLKATSVSRLDICRDMFKVLFGRGYSLTDKIILIDFLVQLYSYHALFDNFPAIKGIFTFTFPNGYTSWRWNSGVITAIARLHNVESIGCQTRAFYLYKYEDVLDCFDRFYFWLPGWHEAFKKYMIYIKEVDYFEDINLLAPVRNAAFQKKRQAETITAAAFPPDCSYFQHYNLGYNLNFLKALFAACERFGNLHILLKPKDPGNINVYRENPEIDSLFNEYAGQMTIVEKQRGHVWDTIESSDMVIGIGFTTPALEAALFGRRVLIYDELKFYNSFLDSMGMQITSSVEQFCSECGKMIEEILSQNLGNISTRFSKHM